MAAPGGICLAAGERGAIRSGMSMGKWGAKTLEMGGWRVRKGSEGTNQAQEAEERACMVYVFEEREGEERVGKRERDSL